MKYILPLVVTLTLVPQLALAAWWNPFSWFTNPPVTTPISLVADSTDIAMNDEEGVLMEEKVVERAAESPVIQTITVQDPALQARVNTLIAENESLKAQVKTLQTQLSSVSSLNTAGNVSDYQSVVDPYLKNLRTIRERIELLEDYYNRKNNRYCYDSGGRDDASGVIIPKCSAIPDEITKWKSEEARTLEKIDEIKIQYGVSTL